MLFLSTVFLNHSNSKNVLAVVLDDGSIGYDYIIIGILLLLFSLNRMYRKRNK